MTLINTVQADGQGSVPAAQLNAYLQTVPNLAALRNFIPRDAMACQLQGYVSQADGGQGIFVWNATATGPDNGTSVIQPIGVTVGCWIRDDPVTASPPPPPPPPPSGFVPYAAQLGLLNFNYTWVGQIDSGTYWPPWDNIDTIPEGQPAGFNPDNIASLAVPVLPAASPPGPTWPGFVIPVTGFYQVYCNINMQYLSGGPFDPALFDTFITTVPFLFPTGAQTLFSDNAAPNFDLTNAFANVNIQGTIQCLAGDAVFVGINDANSFGAQNNVAVTNGSYFGIFRVR